MYNKKKFIKNFKKVNNFFKSNNFLDVDAKLDEDSMKLFLTLVLNTNTKEIVESGVYKGYSTNVLNKFGKKFGINVTSFEYYNTRYLKTLSKKFNIIQENSFSGIPKILKKLKKKKCAILLDGPKRSLAVSFSYFLYNNFNNITFISLDDTNLLNNNCDHLPNFSLQLNYEKKMGLKKKNSRERGALIFDDKIKHYFVHKGLRRFPINPFFFNFFDKIHLFRFYQKIFRFYQWVDLKW
tara:strand:- start:205 stop:918 length:714 start_codon:yes stop_codon:yes gene_type:complete